MFQMKKFICVFVCILTAFSIGIPLLYNDDYRLNAATNYSTGSKVFIGNDSYTVIDPNTMTLLKDTAIDAGEVTWNNAVASLSTLANKYGELGSKAVSNKFTLPKTSDLTLITNNDNTALINIDSINTDWWLGDDSVDNRSKFVGANTNSLVTEVSIIKNVLDEAAKVCNMDQTVTEQGIKPTIDGNDADDKVENVSKGKYFTIQEYGKGRVRSFRESNCTGRLPPSIDLPIGTTYTLQLNAETLDIENAVSEHELPPIVFPIYNTFKELGLEDYIRDYLADPSQGYDKEFVYRPTHGVCHNLDTPFPYKYEG